MGLDEVPPEQGVPGACGSKQGCPRGCEPCRRVQRSTEERFQKGAQIYIYYYIKLIFIYNVFTIIYILIHIYVLFLLSVTIIYIQCMYRSLFFLFNVSLLCINSKYNYLFIIIYIMFM